VLGGGGRSATLVSSLIDLYASGRFPFDRLVQWFELSEVGKALDASYDGDAIKPLLRMPS
jgi:aryl-alcohol dehydrogenase